jgi:glycopeptide antibiotics resistance protein
MAEKNTKIFRKTAYVICSIFIIIYLMLLAYLLFLSPKYGRTEVVSRRNLIPFKTIKNYIKYRKYLTHEIFITNIFGNILAFMPMGFFIPVIFTKNRTLKYRWLIVFIWSGCISLFVEILQYEFSVGSFDVDDIILNSLGGLLGYICFKIIYGIYNRLKKIRIL